MKGLAFLVLALLVVLIGGALYFVYALPADFVRDQIVRQVKERTGRDLKIAGSSSFTLYPSVGISMESVSLSPPPGMAGQPFVTMDRLEASVAVMPLVSREIKLERLVLQKPVFELYTDAKGRKSWDFAELGSGAPFRLAGAAFTVAGAPASDAPGGLPKESGAGSAPARIGNLEQLALGDVRIVDGTVRYADAATGASEQVSSLNVGLELTAIHQPLSAKGDLVWKGEKVDFDGSMTSLKAVLEDRPAKLAVTLKSAPLSARFDGSLAVHEAFDAEGAVTATSPSLRSLATWHGTILPPAAGFGPLEAKGQLRATANGITLGNADLALDGAKATGQIAITTSGERPYIKADLRLSELDLNKYMRPAGTPPPEAAPGAAPRKKAAPETAPAQSIDDLLKRDETIPGPKVQGFAQRTGWSSEAIDFRGLGTADADAKLSIGRLIFQDIKVGQSELTVTLKNRVLKTNFDDIQLYGGRGRGFITVDATGQKAASVGANMSVEGLDGLAFLKDAADFDKLAGTAKLSVAVAGQGSNQLQLVETLNGKADFAFTDGALVGINIPGMVRGLSEGKLKGLSNSPAEKTDFSELTASWTITNGVAQNQDLKLLSPLLRVSGVGNVMMPPRQLDYMMRPKLVSSLAGQGGDQSATGLEVPIRVHGSWDKPKYTPDLSGIMKDPNKALETVKEIGKQLKGKKAGEILNDLLGGTEQDAEQPGVEGSSATPKKKTDPKALLEQFLNQ